MLTDSQDLMTESDFPAQWNPSRPLAGNQKGVAYRTSREEALTMRFIQTHPNRAKKLLTLDYDMIDAEWLILSQAYDMQTIPEPNYITTNPSGGAHVGYFLKDSVGTDKGIKYFDYVHTGLKEVSGSDLAYVGIKTRNPLHPEQATRWMRSEPYTLSELHKFIKPKPKSWYKPRTEVEEHGSRHLALFNQLRQWAYRECLKDSYEVLIMLEGQRINAEFDSPLPLSHVASIVASIERFTSKNFSKKQFSQIQSNRAKKRHGDQGPQTVREILELVDAGLTAREIGELRGQTKGTAQKAIQRAKKAAGRI